MANNQQISEIQHVTSNRTPLKPNDSGTLSLDKFYSFTNLLIIPSIRSRYMPLARPTTGIPSETL